MEKQKRWQFYVIAAVIFLTLINILPTIFFYSKPLKKPIGPERAKEVALSIVDRVEDLKEESQKWLTSFCKNLNISPISVNLKENDPGIFVIKFKNRHDAEVFKNFLPNANYNISFVPAQLFIHPSETADETVVMVARQINIDLKPTEIDRYFHFIPRWDGDNLSEQYKNMIYDRSSFIAHSFTGTSRPATLLEVLAEKRSDAQPNEIAQKLAKEIVDLSETLGEDSPILKRYFASFTQSRTSDKTILIQKFRVALDNLKKDLVNEQKGLLDATDEASRSRQKSEMLNREIAMVERASEIVKKGQSLFEMGKRPFEIEELREQLKKGAIEDGAEELPFAERNVFFKKLTVDWLEDKITLTLFEDVENIRRKKAQTEEANFIIDQLNRFIFNEIARISSIVDENITFTGNEYVINLSKLTNPRSFLGFDLGVIAKMRADSLINHLKADWQPQHIDLVRESYPIYSYEEYQKLDDQAKKLGLVVYTPSALNEVPPRGFNSSSIYVIAKGLDSIIQKVKQNPSSPETKLFDDDLRKLRTILGGMGFIFYSGSSFEIDPAFKQDIIFQLPDYYTTLIDATRENFYVKGSKKLAVLDFTDVEQRIIAINDIEDKIQESLIKWRDDYNAAQVSPNAIDHYRVPPPTKNVYWENFKLTLKKYFRGDDRKIIRWGLDLSGGKTVRIALRDQNMRPVTDPQDLKQVVNELYERVNKMGVAERTIRIENNNIILDFPGSQAFSASELIKASAMYFHIVNEKFSSLNPVLEKEVNQFLQEIWNEAVVTKRKDPQSINAIAWEKLGGNPQTGEITEPRDETARKLFDNGLRLARPNDKRQTNAFDDSLSQIAVMRDENASQLKGQSHPLLIVFYNYALEGSNLDSVQEGYDPLKGYFLNFSVKGSDEKTDGNPRDNFYAWTSQFSAENITGTPKEAYSQGAGWRMAVILNDYIISAPTLQAPIRDGGMITGQFTQREIARMAADLKAGSLSFTPKILSEQNISAELGKEERSKGIGASLIGLFFVAFAMIAYYRFAGLVATCAVLFNLLIMWGVLQNLGAALTLPGIAGIVLTIGMAVDANVLVFERIREEFAISGRLASAIHAGYRKAFSAIVDSNITTIIAAIILIQFDSGPIKGFALTLIIGLISSMFTALFMTRYFFAGWIHKAKNRTLTMARLIGKTSFDFLKHSKKAVIVSLVIITAGSYLLVSQKNTILGMDFTGGYSLVVELKEQNNNEVSLKQQAVDALLNSGASATDFEIRELSRPNQLRTQFGLSMEERGHPFNGLPETAKEENFTYNYEKDPRIVWVVEALKKGGLEIPEAQLQNLDKDWSMMSGQFSDAMRNNALFALSFALISILIYITLRFEFKFAAASVSALAHDVIVTLGIYALFHKAGFPVTIDLEVVGAIMTIIGYSLNDTIIVFDRIREDIKLLRKLKFNEIINHALNITLSRTVMTSATTLLVLLSLVLFGGRSIFDFSLVMTIGVVVGTFSSLFIASPILLLLHNREVANEKRA